MNEELLRNTCAVKMSTSGDENCKTVAAKLVKHTQTCFLIRWLEVCWVL